MQWELREARQRAGLHGRRTRPPPLTNARHPTHPTPPHHPPALTLHQVRGVGGLTKGRRGGSVVARSGSGGRWGRGARGAVTPPARRGASGLAAGDTQRSSVTRAVWTRQLHARGGWVVTWEGQRRMSSAAGRMAAGWAPCMGHPAVRWSQLEGARARRRRRDARQLGMARRSRPTALTHQQTSHSSALVHGEVQKLGSWGGRVGFQQSGGTARAHAGGARLPLDLALRGAARVTGGGEGACVGQARGEGEGRQQADEERVPETSVGGCRGGARGVRGAPGSAWGISRHHHSARTAAERLPGQRLRALHPHQQHARAHTGGRARRGRPPKPATRSRGGRQGGAAAAGALRV